MCPNRSRQRRPAGKRQPVTSPLISAAKKWPVRFAVERRIKSLIRTTREAASAFRRVKIFGRSRRPDERYRLSSVVVGRDRKSADDQTESVLARVTFSIRPVDLQTRL